MNLWFSRCLFQIHCFSWLSRCGGSPAKIEPLTDIFPEGFDDTANDINNTQHPNNNFINEIFQHDGQHDNNAVIIPNHDVTPNNVPRNNAPNKNRTKHGLA